MHSTLLLALGAGSLGAFAINAPVTTGNDPKIAYKAILPQLSTTPIKGSIYAHAKVSGQGVLFNVKFTGLPADGGPYLYHIHENPVPADGNCTATGAHLDPENRGETPACNSSHPATCQVGDLSGKHGKPVAGSYSTVYNDLFLSTIAGSPAFFGNRSFVVHNKDKVRLTCANFSLVVPKNGTSSHPTAASTTATAVATVMTSAAPATATTSTTQSVSLVTPASSTAASTSAVSTGGASAQGFSAAAILLGGVALLF